MSLSVHAGISSLVHSTVTIDITHLCLCTVQICTHLCTVQISLSVQVSFTWCAQCKHVLLIAPDKNISLSLSYCAPGWRDVGVVSNPPIYYKQDVLLLECQHTACSKVSSSMPHPLVWWGSTSPTARMWYSTCEHHYGAAAMATVTIKVV